MNDLKKKFPKGKCVMDIRNGWAAIVMVAPRGKNSAVLNIEAFGIAHEIGDMPCEQFLPITVDEFNSLKNSYGHKNAKIYFKGELT
jgi:hypothetical protein